MFGQKVLLDAVGSTDLSCDLINRSASQQVRNVIQMRLGDSVRKPTKAFMLALGILLYAGTRLVKYAVGPR